MMSGCVTAGEEASSLVFIPGQRGQLIFQVKAAVKMVFGSTVCVIFL